MTSTNHRDDEPRPMPWPHGPVIGWPKPHTRRKALNLAAAAATITQAIALAAIGAIFAIGGITTGDSQPRITTFRTATDSEILDQQRRDLHDLLRAQQTANQETQR